MNDKRMDIITESLVTSKLNPFTRQQIKLLLEKKDKDYSDIIKMIIYIDTVLSRTINGVSYSYTSEEVIINCKTPFNPVNEVFERLLNILRCDSIQTITFDIRFKRFRIRFIDFIGLDRFTKISEKMLIGHDYWTAIKLSSED